MWIAEPHSSPSCGDVSSKGIVSVSNRRTSARIRAVHFPVAAVLVFCGLVFCGSSLQELSAQSVGWSSPSQLTTSTDEVFQPDMAISPHGELHLAWSDLRDGNREIYYMQLDSSGSVLVPETRVSDDPNISRQPSITLDPDGFVHIVWEDSRHGNEEIFHSKLDAGGQILIDNQRLTNHSGRSKLPRICFDSQRLMHMVWQDLRNEVWLLMHQTFLTSGVPETNEDQLTEIPFDAVEPDIAIDAADTVHLVWSDTRRGFNEVVYAKLDTTVSLEGSPVPNSTNVSFSPRIDIGPDQTVHIVWRDFRDQNSEVYYQKQDLQGNILANDIRLTVDWPASLDTFVVGDHTGSANIIWRDMADGNLELRYSRIDRHGEIIVSTERLTFDVADSTFPVMAASPDGLLHVVWKDDRSPDGKSELFHITRDLALAARTGNVNGGAGEVVDVLRINGSTGDPTTRVYTLTPTTPGIVEVAAPPLKSDAKFVLYLYSTEGTAMDARNPGYGIGDLCLSNPMTAPGIQPDTILNGLRHYPLLGSPTQIPRRAPTIALRFNDGIGIVGRMTIQGLIQDPGAPNGQLSVTNALILDSTQP